MIIQLKNYGSLCYNGKCYVFIKKEKLPKVHDLSQECISLHVSLKIILLTNDLIYLIHFNLIDLDFR